MEDVSLLTRVTVNQAGEGLIAQVVSKDTKIRQKYVLLFEPRPYKAMALELGCFEWKNEACLLVIL